MKLTPQAALDIINGHLSQATFEDVAEQAVQQFVQVRLDEFLRGQRLLTSVKFTVDFDTKKGGFYAALSGTF